MQPQEAPCSGFTPGTGFRNESDLTELLGLASAGPRVASPTAPAAAPQPEPEPKPTSRDDIFTSYLKFEQDLSNLCAAQGTLQKLLFGEDWWPIVDLPSTQGIYRVADSAIANLVRFAQQLFATSGVTPEIDQCAALEAVGMERWGTNMTV